MHPAPVLSVPTLVLHGRADTCNHPDSSKGREAFFQGVYERLLLDDAGHLPQHESPQAVADAILQLCQRSRWQTLERAAERCTLFVLDRTRRNGYEDQTSPPSFGNRHRCSAIRFAFPWLLCGPSSQRPPSPHIGAQNRANLLPRIWLQASCDLHERLDTGYFLCISKGSCPVAAVTIRLAASPTRPRPATPPALLPQPVGALASLSCCRSLRLQPCHGLLAYRPVEDTR